MLNPDQPITSTPLSPALLVSAQRLYSQHLTRLFMPSAGLPDSILYSIQSPTKRTIYCVSLSYDNKQKVRNVAQRTRYVSDSDSRHGHPLVRG